MSIWRRVLYFGSGLFDITAAAASGVNQMAGNNEKQRVVVTDVQIPFGSMVVLLVKWALAAIPAMIILLVLGAIFSWVAGWIFHYLSNASGIGI